MPARLPARQLAFLLALLTAPLAGGAEPAAPEGAAAGSAPQSISELVSRVRDGGERRRAELAEREARFLAARNNQRSLLKEATAQRRQAEALADRLRAEYEAGEDELAELEPALDESAGDLREVFTVVHQVAADVQPTVQNSMVSAQLGDRMALLEQLGDSDAIPTAAELRNFWLLLLDEMNQSGRVARFEKPIITASGEEETRRVTRIGTFSALSEGDYLRYLPESGRLLALARQPAGSSRGDTLAFEEAADELASVALDPSRGAILSLIVQAPDVEERIQQGGVIGYIIIVLGFIGLALGIERLVHVTLAARRNRRAHTGDLDDDDHPFAALERVAKNPDYLADVDAMAAKMDEIVTTASQRLTRGLPTLAIFASVSPLLGLLGTVTGMIETFQVITLFGAGDPRLMSGGISQALVTTQLGLAVAIPLLLIHSFVQSRANSLIAALDERSSDLFARSRAEDAADAG